MKLLFGDWVIIFYAQTCKHSIETDWEQFLIIITEPYAFNLLVVNLDLNGLFNEVFIWVSVISENLNGSWSFCFWNTCHNHSSHITAQYLRICHVFTIASLLYASFDLTNASVAACSIYQRMAWRFSVLIILALSLFKWWTEYNNWAVLILLMRISPDRIGQWLTITVRIRFWIKFPHHYGSISSAWYKSSIVL